MFDRGRTDEPGDSHFRKGVVTMRPGSMLEGMFLDVASERDRKILKERFYDRGNYGGAETYALRKIIPTWVKLFNGAYKAKKVRLGVK